MSTHVDHSEHADLTVPKGTAKVGALMVPGFLIGILGLAACGYAYTTNPETVLQSYLFGFIFWITVTLGMFGLTLLIHSIRGSWGMSVIRLYEAGGGPASFVTMAILFIPLAIGMSSLYANWIDPVPGAHFNHTWLTQSGFLIRTAIYFLFWILISAILYRSARTQDRTQDPSEAIKRTNLSSPMIVAFVVSVTLCMTDWVMSLAAPWTSTIFGVWFVVSGGLAGLCFGAAVVMGNAKKEPYAGIVTPNLVKDLGNLIMAFTMLWAYMTLSQYIIIYSGNLPELVSYYINRQNGGFNALGGLVVVFSFFVPFVILLAPRTKRLPRLLFMVACWLLLMRVLDIYWNVIPAFPNRGGSVTPEWTDFAALFGIGGIWLGVFSLQVRRSLLLPQYDERLEIAYHEYKEHLEHA